jgi:hypothetical protein
VQHHQRAGAGAALVELFVHVRHFLGGRVARLGDGQLERAVEDQADHAALVLLHDQHDAADEVRVRQLSRRDEKLSGAAGHRRFIEGVGRSGFKASTPTQSFSRRSMAGG